MILSGLQEKTDQASTSPYPTKNNQKLGTVTENYHENNK